MYFPSYQRYSGQVLRVNGKQGAEAFEMMPNSSAILMDDSGPMVWLVQTDAAGFKQMKAFDIAPHVEPEPITLNDIDARMRRLEELYEKSYAGNANAQEQHT